VGHVIVKIGKKLSNIGLNIIFCTIGFVIGNI